MGQDVRSYVLIFTFPLKSHLIISLGAALKQLGLDRESASSPHINYTEEANYSSLSGETLPHPAKANFKHPACIYRGIVPANNILDHDFAINGAIVSLFPPLIIHWLTPTSLDVCEQWLHF